jgi:hypothetical protein
MVRGDPCVFGLGRGTIGERGSVEKKRGYLKMLLIFLKYPMPCS